ncbi:VOC family protein [Rhizorhabdus dicambivorans]|uniref:VOC domain-containing protein n=1 Tax=Rhizorhabdus dicambivorans TaxID=1850238 RepID=A0A2A4FY09_9SPHN|nr:VOC family protein [Rhizorhabdus dicambivorans]ATE64141.1 hypothetical protein CMV14_06840 [Rhizorhabdus dicambivorans]PCE42588.1 hypothetical protein COO09_09240 [Rhizorhabdus dicambivorans]
MIENPLTNFTHIGVVTHDIGETCKRYEALGIGPFTYFDLPSEDDFMTFKSRHHFGVSADGHKYKVAWGSWGPIAMEVFQPVSGDSIPQRFLDTKGEGVWHYGYDVEDMAVVEAFMSQRGYSVIGASETMDGVKMCYFGTADHGGVYFQAHEVPPSSDMYERLSGGTGSTGA